MATPDPAIVARLRVLRDNLYYLHSERALVTSFGEYLGNIRLKKAVERALHLATEACLDIGRRIIALERLRYPDDNQDLFVVLADASIVPDSLLPSLIDMARFRNLIVHEYIKIDDAKVYQIFMTRLGDFDRFVAALNEYFEAE